MKCTIVLVGVTGDLSKKKLIPAIYNLMKSNKLNDFIVVGVARSLHNPVNLLSKSKQYIKSIDKKSWKKLESKFYYFRADMKNDSKVCKLGSFVRDLEKKHNLPGNRMFYLATLPDKFDSIINGLTNCGLNKEIKSKTWTRVVFEKPFGNDLKSARCINKCIKKAFTENQTYRIDHYLGKELVQDITIARFTNAVLEPIWNNKYIDHVQIVLSEDFGVESRAEFYDKYGALKDVVQNHMLQLTSLVAMESPKYLTAKEIRDKKLQLLKNISPIKKENLVLGQYKGYNSIKKIPSITKTETFAALKLKINNNRWKNVPFYLIAGKNLKYKLSSIYIQFKQTKCFLFKDVCAYPPNHLHIQIQPFEGLYLQLNTKQPGKTLIMPADMQLSRKKLFRTNSPEAYEKLLIDVMNGDQSLFVRADEIEQQWKIVDSIIKNKPKPEIYEKGKIPSQAVNFIRKDNRNWNFHIHGDK